MVEVQTKSQKHISLITLGDRKVFPEKKSPDTHEMVLLFPPGAKKELPQSRAPEEQRWNDTWHKWTR